MADLDKLLKDLEKYNMQKKASAMETPMSELEPDVEEEVVDADIDPDLGLPLGVQEEAGDILEEDQTNTVGLEEKAAALANRILQKLSKKKKPTVKKASMTKQAAAWFYNRGAQLADMILNKYAADVAAIEPVIDQLLAQQLIQADQKQQLLQALAASPELNSASINQATSGMPNAQQIADALLAAIDKKEDTEAKVVQAAMKILKKKKRR